MHRLGACDSHAAQPEPNAAAIGFSYDARTDAITLAASDDPDEHTDARVRDRLARDAVASYEHAQSASGHLVHTRAADAHPNRIRNAHTCVHAAADGGGNRGASNSRADVHVISDGRPGLHCDGKQHRA